MELSFRPEWENIENTRAITEEFCVSRGLPPEAVEAVVMIVSELSENAIKYGHFDSAEDRIGVILGLEDGEITIEVINPVGPETYPRLEDLDTTIQWIRSFQDPFEAYTERLREVSRKGPAGGVGGLGLARVAYEAQAILDFFVDEEGMLNVSAISNITEGA